MVTSPALGGTAFVDFGRETPSSLWPTKSDVKDGKHYGVHEVDPALWSRALVARGVPGRDDSAIE